MRFLRSLLFYVYLGLFTVVYALACVSAFPFMPTDRRYWMGAAWCRAVLAGLHWLNGISYRVEGMENLPDGPAVILSKHQSTWEALAFLILMPRPLCYVFKRELLYVPFFGWVMAMLRMIHVDRRDGRHAFESVVQQGRARMAEGAWIVMFPEGTRTPVGQQGTYKTGGARFAAALGARVVPIAHNAGRVWPRHVFTKYPGTVTLSIGKPIDTAGLSPNEINQRVEAWIEAEMRRIDPDAYQAGS